MTRTVQRSMVTESAGWGAHVAVCRHWLLHAHQSGEAAIISLSPGATQIWAPRTNWRNLVLGQRRPSGKSREAGRPGNSEDRQPTQAALADNNPHDRSIGDGPVTRTAWDNIQRLHIRTSPLPPSKDTSTNNPYQSTHFPVQSMLYILKILTYP